MGWWGATPVVAGFHPQRRQAACLCPQRPGIQPNGAGDRLASPRCPNCDTLTPRSGTIAPAVKDHSWARSLAPENEWRKRSRLRSGDGDAPAIAQDPMERIAPDAAGRSAGVSIAVATHAGPRSPLQVPAGRIRVCRDGQCRRHRYSLEPRPRREASY